MADPGARVAAAPGWRQGLPGVAFALIWIVGWYWTTAAAMVGIWMRSETFAHGFVVPPIAMWLVWRERERLRAIAPRPSAWILALLAAAGFAWLLGELAAVNAVTQAALVALLVLTVPAILGVRVARAIAFPLGFLFFAVPVGEFLLPQLMEWTADFTVMAVRLSGVPVFREGQQFVIPSGRWSVVEACSGVRYLIASIVVGTLYAYLTYRSLTRRIAFIGVSILVPIVANWVRAYLIVMLGHVSGNRLAVGVDHLIYGWAFFGVVMLAMFWVGARWRQDDPPPTQRSSARPLPSGGPVARGLWPAAVAVAVVTAAWPLAYRAVERSDAAAPVRLAPLATIGGWESSTGGLTDWQPRFQDPSADLHRSFDRGGQKVGLYLGYYRDQTYGRKLVSSENVLVISKDPLWAQVAGGTRLLVAGGVPIDVRVAELRRSDGQRLIVWQWYWVAGRMTASDYRAKAWNAWSRLTGRGDDAAVVIIYTPKTDGHEADATLDAFVRDAAPAVDAALRKTWSDR